MATMMLIVWNSAFSDKIVVMVPAPAINGNAKGTTLAVLGDSSLKAFFKISIAKDNKYQPAVTALGSYI
mgnify:CR=1 FL=1